MITKQVNNNITARKKTVFVVDDHPIVRQGLTLLINQEADLAVCGEAEEMHSALSAIQAARPDILLWTFRLMVPMDWNCSRTSGSRPRVSRS